MSTSRETSCMSEPDIRQMAIWRMRIACWRTKVADRNKQNMQYLLLFHCSNVARTLLDVTLYVHCLFCLYCKCVFLDLHRCVGRHRCLLHIGARSTALESEFQPRHVCPAAPSARIFMKHSVGQCYRFLHPFQRCLKAGKYNTSTCRPT